MSDVEIIRALGALQYRTRDGQIFDDLAAARHRQAEIDLSALVRKMAGMGCAIDAAILHNLNPLLAILVRLQAARSALIGGAA